MSDLNYESLRVAQKGDVLTVFLYRPEARNAINMRLVNDLDRLIDAVTDAADVRVVVFRGLPEVFSSGIDLADFPIDRRRDIYGLQKWERVCRAIERLGKFTIAAVQGECIGGGFQLVLLCDVRLAERQATFCLNEVRMGFLPGMATFRLAKYVGFGRAKSLLLAARTLRAEEALQWGILDAVYDQECFEEAIKERVCDLRSLHPAALEMARRLLEESYAAEYEDFLGCFLAAQHRAINSRAFGRQVAGESKEKHTC